MKKIYYATFDKGLNEIVKKIIKKQDKNAFIKRLYDDAVVFSADEHFKTMNSCFKSVFVVIDSCQKEGVGAINNAMKYLLEKKDFKISFSRDVKSFKFLILKEDAKVAVDAKLKQAVEIMLSRKSKRQISYLNGTEEIVLLSKKDGLNLLMRKIIFNDNNSKIRDMQIDPEQAYVLNFLSEPAQSETVVDPFAYDGVVTYIRSFGFKKANVIANEKNADNVIQIKKLAKTLKDKTFSVMNYDFLSDKFPIKFIDKIVTVLPSIYYDSDVSLSKLYESFFKKAYKLNVKLMAVAVYKSIDISQAIKDKYEIKEKVSIQKYNLFKLEIKNTTI